MLKQTMAFIIATLFTLLVSLAHAQITRQWVLELNRENCEFRCEGGYCGSGQPSTQWIRCRSPDKGANWECTSNLRQTHHRQLVDTSVIWTEPGRCRVTFSHDTVPPPGFTTALVHGSCEVSQGLLNLFVTFIGWIMYPIGVPVYPLNLCHESRPEHEYTAALRVWASPPREERPVVGLWDMMATIGILVCGGTFIVMLCGACNIADSRLAAPTREETTPAEKRTRPVRAKREKAKIEKKSQ